MSFGFIFVVLALIVFIPVIGSLLYVWWKYGKDEEAVTFARSIYLLGVSIIILGMVAVAL